MVGRATLLWLNQGIIRKIFYSGIRFTSRWASMTAFSLPTKETTAFK